MGQTVSRIFKPTLLSGELALGRFLWEQICQRRGLFQQVLR
jgi:hypothetical protein